jgi:uncharacterized membrane protein SirB2
MTLPELYPVLKLLHVGLALASGALFALRGAGVLLGKALPMRAPVRRLSYAIDTALLAAALGLLALLRLNPFATSWLAVKLAFLVAYIVLGTLALRRARGRLRKGVAYVAALLCFGAMYAVARSHDPLGFWRWGGG